MLNSLKIGTPALLVQFFLKPPHIFSFFVILHFRNQEIQILLVPRMLLLGTFELLLSSKDSPITTSKVVVEMFCSI